MKKLAIVFVVISCSLVYSGEIQKRHMELTKGKDSPSHGSQNVDSLASATHGITEIGLERTACFGSCPVYTVIFKNDGTVRYVGEANAEYKGERKGTIPVNKFNMLAHFIKDSNYMKLDSTYATMITDLPTVYTRVVMNGKEKVIKDYANAGPSKLWAIEQLIDMFAKQTTWDAAGATKKAAP